MTTPPPPQQPQPAAERPLTPAEDSQWAMIGHLAGIISWLGPLVVWLIFRHRGRFTDQEAKEALNFQITITIGVIGLAILSVILSFVGIGVLVVGLSWLLQLTGVVFAIIAGVAVNNGRAYRYPFALRLIS